MVTHAQGQAGVTTADVVSSDILPPTQDGVARIGGYMISRVRLHLASGTERTEEIWCIGIGGGMGLGADDACNHDPKIGIGAGDVVRDVPCSGEPPAGCATLPPTPRPDVQAMARPLPFNPSIRAAHRSAASTGTRSTASRKCGSRSCST
jgi:hypothetical protein